MSYNEEIPSGYGYVACQICGKPVLTKLPFAGCMFCSECMTTNDDWAWQANSEEFKQPFREERND